MSPVNWKLDHARCTVFAAVNDVLDDLAVDDLERLAAELDFDAALVRREANRRRADEDHDADLFADERVAP